jgi:hypothetical protein
VEEEAVNGEPGKNGEFSMATACKMAWQGLSITGTMAKR